MVLFGMQNRTFGAYVAAIHRIHISVMTAPISPDNSSTCVRLVGSLLKPPKHFLGCQHLCRQNRVSWQCPCSCQPQYQHHSDSIQSPLPCNSLPMPPPCSRGKWRAPCIHLPIQRAVCDRCRVTAFHPSVRPSICLPVCLSVRLSATAPTPGTTWRSAIATAWEGCQLTARSVATSGTIRTSPAGDSALLSKTGCRVVGS
jgi:hypothetical protein